MFFSGPGHGGDCEAVGLDLCEHRGSPGRIRREGENLIQGLGKSLSSCHGENSNLWQN